MERERAIGSWQEELPDIFKREYGPERPPVPLDRP